MIIQNAQTAPACAADNGGVPAKQAALTAETIKGRTRHHHRPDSGRKAPILVTEG
jgi:hypothetical protein